MPPSPPRPHPHPDRSPNLPALPPARAAPAGRRRRPHPHFLVGRRVHRRHVLRHPRYRGPPAGQHARQLPQLLLPHALRFDEHVHGGQEDLPRRRERADHPAERLLHCKGACACEGSAAHPGLGQPQTNPFPRLRSSTPRRSAPGPLPRPDAQVLAGVPFAAFAGASYSLILYGMTGLRADAVACAQNTAINTLVLLIASQVSGAG